ILGQNPLGYWRLGDSQTSDMKAHDETGHMDGLYTGRYTNAPATAPPLPNQPGALLGDRDGSAYFYISNNYGQNPVTQYNFVNVPYDPSQAPAGHELTLEAWFTITPNSLPQTYAAIIFKATPGAWVDGYGLFSYSGSLYFYINNLNIRVGAPYSGMGDI